jgi:N6-L-threonylcarbamoyladenine synthase
LGKLIRATKETGIKEVTVAGGVSANSGLREGLKNEAARRNWKLFLPEPAYTTDNAAMIAITAYYKYLRHDFSGHDAVPFARMQVNA